MEKEIDLRHGDCLEVMKNIPDKSIDMVLCDLPYGTTCCKWDMVIPFEPLWEQYERICHSTSAIILFACEPFASYLRLSNLKNYRYDWIWDKCHPTGQLNAAKQPLRQYENLCVFYEKQCIYNPVFHKNRLKREFVGTVKKTQKQSEDYGRQYDYNSNITSESLAYPRNIIKQTAVIGNSKEKVSHPTQKPVPLLEYLIRTYTNEDELVLDNCMGSGSTGVACINTNRRFIGIEKDDGYFQIAKERIEESQKQTVLFKEAI